MQPLIFDTLWLVRDPFRLFRVLLWETNYGTEPHIVTRLIEWLLIFGIISFLRSWAEKQANVSRLLRDLYSKAFLGSLFLYLAYPTLEYAKAWLSGEVTVFTFAQQSVFNGTFPEYRRLWTEEMVIKSNLYGSTLTFAVVSMVAVSALWLVTEGARSDIKYLLAGPAPALFVAAYRSLTGARKFALSWKYSLLAAVLYYLHIPNQYLYIEAGYTNRLLSAVETSNPTVTFYSESILRAYHALTFAALYWLSSRTLSYDALLNILMKVTLAVATIVALYRYPAIVVCSIMAVAKLTGGTKKDDIDLAHEQELERSMIRNGYTANMFVKGTEGVLAVLAFLAFQASLFIAFICVIWWFICDFPTNVAHFFSTYG